MVSQRKSRVAAGKVSRDHDPVTLKGRAALLPSLPGVYLMKDSGGKIIYIGKAKNLKNRVSSYFVKADNLKTMFLVSRIRSIDYVLTPNDTEAYLLEANLIKKHRPRYNVRLKDDKAYPYIRLSMEDAYPRLYMERKIKSNGSVYFGPYTISGFVRSMIQFLNEKFKIRDCKNTIMRSQKKPCITHQMGYCDAPCVYPVSRDSYRKSIRQAKDFLNGRYVHILRDLKKQVRAHSDALQFEEAIRVRDFIKSIEEICGKSKSLFQSVSRRDMDVINFTGGSLGVLFHTLHVRAGSITGDRFFFEPGSFADSPLFVDHFLSFILQYYMENLIPDTVLIAHNAHSFSLSKLKSALCALAKKEVRVAFPKTKRERDLVQFVRENTEVKYSEYKKKQGDLLEGLKQIQKKFSLPGVPYRMECYDVSHLQGQGMVGSQVVFERGEAKPEDYRKYKIKTVKKGDDFGAIKELLTRRLKHREMDTPDLIVVDGGSAQLKMARQALQEVNPESEILMVGMAKSRVEKNFRAKEVKKFKEERFFLPMRKNPVFFTHPGALNILIRLRDEAHRFAISYHRKVLNRQFLGKASAKKTR